MGMIPNIKADKQKQLNFTDDWMVKKLVEHEGFRLNPYVDTEGYMTGGIGHKFTKEDFNTFRNEWSDDQKMKYWQQKFEEDFATASKNAERIANENGVKLTGRNKYVLTDMVFNLGDKGVRGFPSFLKALAVDDIDTAEKEMKQVGADDPTPSKWYTQVPNRVDSLVNILRSSK